MKPAPSSAHPTAGQETAEGPINPPPAKGARDGELPAYVSNGLIGLRVREVPLVAGMAIVSGLVGEHPERRIEAAAVAPYPLAGDLAIDGVWLHEQPWALSDLVQTYDFARGELHSRFAYTVDDKRLEVEVVTFASRTAPALVLQETTVRANQPCQLGLRAIVDVEGMRGRVARRRTDTPGEEEPVCDGSLLWQTDGALSTCGVAYFTELLGDEQEGRRMGRWDPTGPLSTEYSVKAPASRPLRLRQIAGLIPSLLHDRPDEEAVRQVWRGKDRGFDALREDNRSEWASIWRGRPVLRGARREHQALVDAAFYYLNASVHPASPSATSIFGLATWRDYHYYYGHVMWDIDAFCVPSLILTQPRAARAILDFRTRGLEAARTNARLALYDGLQFPWQAAPLSGQESAPGTASAAAHEHHGTLHVARAFSLYADLTGDEAFLREKAWPILSGVADWVVSRVTPTGRGFELIRATGPAEVPDPPDNDAFSLMTMRDVLQRALRAAERTGNPASEQWRKVLDGLYLPHRSDGAIISHDGFWVNEEKGATPSPLAGLFPMDYPATPTETRKTLALYLKLWKDYVGAPMLPALYPVWAAMAGDRKLALKLFEEAYVAYDAGRFHQCLEYRRDHPDSQTPAGPFFANLGGMLLGLVFGLSGLVVDDGDPADWPRRPVVLPEGWTAIEIERLWVRGRAARMTARHGAERSQLAFIDED